MTAITRSKSLHNTDDHISEISGEEDDVGNDNIDGLKKLLTKRSSEITGETLDLATPMLAPTRSGNFGNYPKYSIMSGATSLNQFEVGSHKEINHDQVLQDYYNSQEQFGQNWD